MILTSYISHKDEKSSSFAGQTWRITLCEFLRESNTVDSGQTTSYLPSCIKNYGYMFIVHTTIISYKCSGNIRLESYHTFWF